MTMMKKKRVLLRAPLLSQSGYGVHSRQLARWLFDLADKNGNLEVHTELLRWGNTPWYVDQYAFDGLIGRCFQATANHIGAPSEPYDVTFQLQLPNEWCPSLGRFNVGITAGIEATTCNPLWIGAVNSMDLVIVPSEFSKQAFINTAPAGMLKTEIVVVPESFPDAILNKDSISSLPLELTTKFNFLVFGQATGGDAEADRKNLPYTLKWLSEAFANNPDVGIILKTNAGRFSMVDKLTCENMFTKLLTEIKAPNNPKIYLLHGDMSDQELVGLYKHPSIKALVTLTHGEGFGLPILEAAACDIPVIATNWSAHTEFLNLGKYIEIDSELQTIPQSRVDGHIWVQNSKWAVPQEAKFKEKIMKFYQRPHTPKEWAKTLGEKIRQKYQFSAISEKYTSVLSKFL